MRVLAVVVSWNSARDLAGCLDALDACDHDPLRITVVDNASTDGSAALLERLAAQPRRDPLTVVHAGANLGFCGGVNLALASDEHGGQPGASGAPWADAVLLVNPDVRVTPELVRRLCAVLSTDPRCGSVQPRLVRRARTADGASVLDTTGHELTSARLVRNRGEGELDAGRYDEADEVFGVSGACALHRRAMLDDVAWRDGSNRAQWLTDDLFAYFDDVELDWRARMLGWSARYEPDAVGVHQRGGAGPRRTPPGEALNWSNRLLWLATCDDPGSRRRAAGAVALTTTLKTVELGVSQPPALLAGLRRLRLLPAARQRRTQLMTRAVMSPGAVVARYAVPLRFGPWVATWWRRVTGRSPGVR